MANFWNRALGKSPGTRQSSIEDQFSMEGSPVHSDAPASSPDAYAKRPIYPSFLLHELDNFSGTSGHVLPEGDTNGPQRYSFEGRGSPRETYNVLDSIFTPSMVPYCRDLPPSVSPLTAPSEVVSSRSLETADKDVYDAHVEDGSVEDGDEDANDEDDRRCWEDDDCCKSSPVIDHIEGGMEVIRRAEEGASQQTPEPPRTPMRPYLNFDPNLYPGVAFPHIPSSRDICTADLENTHGSEITEEYHSETPNETESISGNVMAGVGNRAADPTRENFHPMTPPNRPQFNHEAIFKVNTAARQSTRIHSKQVPEAVWRSRDECDKHTRARRSRNEEDPVEASTRTDAAKSAIDHAEEAVWKSIHSWSTADQERKKRVEDWPGLRKGLDFEKEMKSKEFRLLPGKEDQNPKTKRPVSTKHYSARQSSKPVAFEGLFNRRASPESPKPKRQPLPKRHFDELQTSSPLNEPIKPNGGEKKLNTSCKKQNGRLAHDVRHDAPSTKSAEKNVPNLSQTKKPGCTIVTRGPNKLVIKLVKPPRISDSTSNPESSVPSQEGSKPSKRDSVPSEVGPDLGGPSKKKKRSTLTDLQSDLGDGWKAQVTEDGHRPSRSIKKYYEE
ncbi:hypothetical protein F5Y15DRAFT_180516 [Xylariaceae sp. FL0016]|nr:hypothetical protein F5Y15DRAFT_180516 [Xylariaceae sp. FL0016]